MPKLHVDDGPDGLDAVELNLTQDMCQGKRKKRTRKTYLLKENKDFGLCDVMEVHHKEPNNRPAIFKNCPCLNT